MTEDPFEKAQRANAAGQFAEAIASAKDGLSGGRASEGLLWELWRAAAALPDGHPERASGLAACDQHARAKGASQPGREAARSGLALLAPLLSEVAPSFSPKRLAIDAPPTFFAMNTTVAAGPGGLMAVVRCVNYARYYTPVGTVAEVRNQRPPAGGLTLTRNIVAGLDPGLQVKWQREIADPPRLQYEPNSPRGMEDCRLFHWRGSPWVSATTLATPAGMPAQIAIARLNLAGSGMASMDSFRLLNPKVGRVTQKNWMPWVRAGGEDLRFVYSVDPPRVLGENGSTLWLGEPHLEALDWIKGGSQILTLPDGDGLALVHEQAIHQNGVVRDYLQRFARFSPRGDVVALSRPFYMTEKRQVDFAAGLCAHPGDPSLLVVSYGFDDRESWAGSIRLEEALALLRPTGRR